MALADLVTGRLPMRGSIGDNASTGYLDGIVGRLPMRGSIGDAVSSADAIAGLFKLLGAMVDSQNASDAIAGLFKYFGSMADASDFGDSIIGLQQFLAQFDDDAGMQFADLVEALQSLNAVLEDNFDLALDDLIEAALIEMGVAFPLEHAFGEDFAAADLASALQSYLGLIDDDASAGGDILSAVQVLLAEISESGNAIDETAARLAFLAIIADAAGFDDLAEYAFGGMMSYLFGEALLPELSDQISGLQSYRASIDDALGSVDELSAICGLLIVLSDLYSPTDAMEALFIHRAIFADDGTTAYQDLVDYLFGGTLAYAFSENAGTTDAMTALFGYRASMTDDASSWMVDLLFGLQRQLGVITDNVAGSDQLSALMRHRALMGDQASYADDLLAIGRIVYGIGDAIAAADALAALQPYLAGIADNAGITDGMLALLIYRGSIGDANSDLSDIILYTNYGSNVIPVSFGDSTNPDDIVVIKGAGITWISKSAKARLFGSDIKAIVISGADLKPARLFGTDEKSMKLRGN